MAGKDSRKTVAMGDDCKQNGMFERASPDFCHVDSLLQDNLRQLDASFQQLQRARSAVIRQFYGELYGLTETQLVVLGVVRSTPPGMCMSISELADAAFVASSSMSRIVDGLVRREYLCRREASDRRYLSIVLTPTGEELMAQMRELDKKFQSCLVQNLPSEDLRVWQRMNVAIALNAERLLTQGTTSKAR